MSINPNFIRILRCPKRLCRGDIEAHVHENEEFLKCKICGDIYPIEDGIPIMFPNAQYSKEIHKRHWDKEDNALNYAKKYNNYLKKQGSPWGLYTHVSEVNAIERLLRHANCDLNGKIILDCGCGNARILSLFPQASLKIGVDTSIQLLKESKKREPDFWFVCAQLEDLPFKDGIADFSTSIRVFQHIHAPEDAFNEMARVTKPSGYISLELYNKLNLKEAYKRLRMTKFLNKIKPWGLDYDRYYSYREIKDWCDNNFIQIQKFCGAGWGIHFYFFDLIKFRSFPHWIQKPVYDFFFWLENKVGTLPFFSITLEKIAFIGSLQGSSKRPNVFTRFGSALRRNEQIKNAAVLKDKLEDRNHCFVGSDRQHLDLTLDWIKAAQDAVSDSGVSRGYSLISSSKTNRFGWQPSYPETTGYIIPTLLAAANLTKNPDLVRRAKLMADWELSIILKNEAAQGGNIKEKPVGAIFDTGQVIRGLLVMYDLTKENKYMEQAQKSAAWILNQENSMGGYWDQDNAACVSQSSMTYNIYAIAPLVQIGHNAEYHALAGRVVDFTLSQQLENGWFKKCDFNDDAHPLLHTIGYTIDGLWDIGQMLNIERAKNRAVLALNGALSAMREDGSISGRLDSNWSGTVNWSCLTGLAQIGVTCMKVYKKTGEKRYLDAAVRIKNKLKACQNNISQENGLRGAVWGSWPISGDYGQYQALNWAAKYFADLLIECLSLDSSTL